MPMVTDLRPGVKATIPWGKHSSVHYISSNENEVLSHFVLSSKDGARAVLHKPDAGGLLI